MTPSINLVRQLLIAHRLRDQAMYHDAMSNMFADELGVDGVIQTLLDLNTWSLDQIDSFTGRTPGDWLTDVHSQLMQAVLDITGAE